MKKFLIFIYRLIMRVGGRKLNYKITYRRERGHFPDLKNPKDMSEILISKLFNKSLCMKYTSYIDKVKVRDYVRSKGLDDILLKHYGVWDKPEDIPFNELPEKFVLKSNNGCGNHVICANKSNLNYKEAIKTLNKAIRLGEDSWEPHYRYIKPCVFAEELIETHDGSWPIDYKFTCIGGEIMDVFVATERETHTKYSTFDLQWNPLPYIRKEYMPSKQPSCPEHLQELVKVAKVLAKDFDFVRVDLYEYKGKPYISELTFFPWGGLLYGYKDEALNYYGQKWHELNKR